jgi:hypothetical protein
MHRHLLAQDVSIRSRPWRLLLLAVAAMLAAAAISAVAARATPITPPVTFCLNGETVTFSDTTDTWRGIAATPQAIAFLTMKAQTTGVFLLANKHGVFHPVTVSLGACANDEGDDNDNDQGEDADDQGGDD